MPASSNPLFRNQWHFNEIGDIEAVWEEYDGSGVSVLVADDGVEASHSDLDGNYDGSLTFSGSFGSDSGLPRIASSGHGTSVAGLIAAEDNTQGGIGVAHGASLTGLNLIENGGSEARGAAMVRFAANFDIMNNSWGYGPDFVSSPSPSSSPEDGGSLEGRAFNYIADEGRGGLGTISVKAAGNERSNAQGEWLNNQHQTIVVSATDRRGDAASFSNIGTNILISAPAATHTTDRLGGAGYNSGAITGDFGGTSGSTPIVAGVAALMLDANPNLGWRDVQAIIAISAQHTGSDLGDGARRFERGEWFSNGADNWNGGGMTFNVSYGFGKIDAHAAVRMAEAWHLFEPAQRSGNEREVKASYTGIAQQVRDQSTTSYAIEVSPNIDIEHIYVEIEGNHTYIGDLEITLISPTGERYMLADNDGGATNLEGWTFGVAAARGDTSRGTWTVEVHDTAQGDTGTISDVNLTFTGGAVSNHTVHHFTNDFLDYAAAEGARRDISDTNGGYDWLNLVALTGNVTLNMAEGGSLTVDGRRWATIDRGTSIEAVALGDGDDYIGGNDLANRVFGGRGQDRIYGREGNDLLYGEQGNDRLFGQVGNDRLDGGEGNDALYGQEGADRLFGRAGNDLAYGGDQRDTVYGDVGNDTVYGGNDNDAVWGNNDEDVLWGDRGDDYLHGGLGDDTVSGGTGNDRVLGSGGNDVAAGRDGDDVVTGDDGNDTVSGGNGDDRVYGGRGNDLVLGQVGNDWVIGDSGDDSIYGHQGNDTLNGNDGDDRVIGGDGNDLMYGANGDDRMYDQGGNDEVYAGAGNDLIYAGAGNDILSGGSGADQFVFVGTFGNDRITDFSLSQDELRIDGDFLPGSTTAADVVATARLVNGDVVLDLGSAGTITLDGIGSTAGLEAAIEII